ncbi:MAG: signal peptide peptidase SppA [Polyangiales bacterium]
MRADSIQQIGRPQATFGALLAVFAIALGASEVAAQPVERSTLLDAPGTPLSAPDDAAAVDLNPAALGHLGTWSLQFTHIEAPGRALGHADGDALRLATPLLFGTAIGVSVNSVRPEFPGQLSRGTGSLALAYAPNANLSFGTAFRVSGSNDPAFAGRMGWDVAASWRPASTLAISLIARDINAAADLGNAGGTTPPSSFVLAAGLRPLGSDQLLVDVTTGVDSDGAVGARGMVLTRLPYVGRACLGGEVRRLDLDPVWLALGGLSVDWGRLSAGGGLMGAEGSSTAGFFVHAAVHGRARAGVPTARYVLDLEISSAGARGILALLMELERARLDANVAGVLLRLRGTGLGTAHAEELREAFARLRREGKPVVCHLDAASGQEFYACAAATHAYFDPAGGARLTGPAGTSIYLGDALRELGVRTEFVRIGAYKSAPEQFTAASGTDAAREARAALYDDVYTKMRAVLASDWRTTDARIDRLVDNGPYVTSELVERKLIRGAADERDMGEALRAAFGGDFARLESRPAAYDTAWATPRRVGVVVVDGDIVDGDNIDVPFIGIQCSGGKTISETLDAMAADPNIGAIVLRIDSPGGSVLASDQIWRAVMRARRQKPVVASMGAVAASGGYYIASGADEIWADAATLTGSIGVFFGKADIAELAQKLHIGTEETSRGRRAGVDSMWQPLSDDERQMISEKVLLWYQMFLRRIEEGRGMDPEQTDALARGRVWSGTAAAAHGLVDHVGGFTAALDRARRLADIDDSAQVMFAPTRPVTLLDFALRALGLGLATASTERSGEDTADAATPLPPMVRQMASTLTALMAQREGVGLARMEDVVFAAP